MANNKKIYASCQAHTDCGHYGWLEVDATRQSCTMTHRVAPWSPRSTASAVADALLGRPHDTHALTVNYEELKEAMLDKTLNEEQTTAAVDKLQRHTRTFDVVLDEDYGGEEVVTLSPDNLLCCRKDEYYYAVDGLTLDARSSVILYSYETNTAISRSKQFVIDILIEDNFYCEDVMEIYNERLEDLFGQLQSFLYG